MSTIGNKFSMNESRGKNDPRLATPIGRKCVYLMIFDRLRTIFPEAPDNNLSIVISVATC